MKKIFTIICCIFTFASFAQNEILDQTFGTSGRSFSGGYLISGTRQILVQPDGKIIQQGKPITNTSNYTSEGFQLKRYNADGSDDNTFGVNSFTFVTYDITYGGAPTPQSLALQNDGKIITGGSYASDPTYAYSDVSLVRYNPNGSVDNTFGTNGIVITNIPGKTGLIANIQVQPDGKIIAAGGTRSGSYGQNPPHSLLLRYNSDGTLDNTFGTGGKVETTLGTTDDVYHLALQSDGKIVITGGANIGTHTQFATLRFNSNGTPDNSFGINGQVITNLGSSANDANSILIQLDGKIVIAGTSTYTNSTPQLAILRYNSDGTSDVTFNPTTFTSGYLLMAAGSQGGTFNSILQQADFKLIFCAELDNLQNNVSNGSSKFQVVKLNITGTLDNTFNQTGKAIIDLGLHNGGGFLKFQGSKLILGGSTSFYPPNSSFESSQPVVARLLNSVGGVLPITLLNFTAQKQGDNATLVQWKTSSEINSNYFDVEKSNDAINFQSIGKVNAAGNSSIEMSYSFTDNQPLKGVNYYRLKQVDLDGRLFYSPARFVKFDDVAGLVKYYPNPTNGILNIEITPQMQQEAMVISISNASGVVVDQIKRQANTTNILMIDMKRFAKGTYFIQLQTNTTNSTQRIVLE